jgi:hypothetical protein
VPQKQAQAPRRLHLSVVGIQPPVQRRPAAENHNAIQNPLASGTPDPFHYATIIDRLFNSRQRALDPRLPKRNSTRSERFPPST